MPGIRALAFTVTAMLLAAQPVAAQVVATPTEIVADRLLAAHNTERLRLGLKPFTWRAKLAGDAKKWAQTLAVSNMFEHAPVAANGGEGENLWYGTRDAYTPEEMIGFFIDERKAFKRGTFPDVSTTGRWQDVGHYTQLVWQDTREVGCAIVSNRTRDYLVCRYAPAGNFIGKPVYDYQAAAAKRYVTAAPAAPEAAKSATVSPSGPKKRASKKRRHGG